MGAELFVPEDFVVPDGLIARDFRLTPLGPQHNEADYAAWTSSIDHIRATPGSARATGHARCPSLTISATWSGTPEISLSAAGSRIPCSASAPAMSSAAFTSTRSTARDQETERRRHASVESWVRADHAALDAAVHDAVVAWLERDWPFDSIEYAPRT